MVKKILALPLLLFAFVSIMAVELSAAYDESNIPENYELLYSDTVSPQESKPIDISPSFSAENNYIAVLTVQYEANTEKNLLLENGVFETNFVFNSSTYTGTYSEIENTYTLELSDVNRFIWNETSIDGSPSLAADEIVTLNIYGEETGIIKSIFGTISAVVIGGVGVISGIFTGDSTIINVFWTPATEADPGSLTLIGYLTLIPVGFVLVRWGFSKVLKLLRMRG